MATTRETPRWERQFAARTRGDVGEGIANILALLAVPGLIPFGGGFPDPSTFPRERAAALLAELGGGAETAAFQYAPTRGLAGTLDVLAQRIETLQGRRPAEDELLVTSGAMEALELVGKSFLDRGDVVVVEGPTYLGAIMAFRSFEADVVAVSVDEHGLDVVDLERRLTEGLRPKLLYTIPDHQNPAGVTLSAERRQALVELAERHGFVVVEDVAYRELGFEDDAPPSLWSLAPDLVVQAGTTSKTFFPGVRLGWTIAPPAVSRQLVAAKQNTDQCAGALGQRLFEEYVRRGWIDEQLAASRKLYRRKCERMLAALERYMPPGARWTRPRGGFFSWLTLPAGNDAADVTARAVAAGVGVVPGLPFFPDARGDANLRLSYSLVDETQIDSGIELLASLLPALSGSTWERNAAGNAVPSTRPCACAAPCEESSGVEAADVVRQADEAGLRLVRFLWCGNDGTIRAKASAVKGLETRMRSGIGLTVAMQAMNALDQLQPLEGLGPVGEIRLVPDPETFRVLPYAPNTGAMLVDHVQLDGTPAPVDQRGFLKRMEERLRELDARLEVAFENEFSLATRVDGQYVPIDSGLCFSTISATAAQDYVDDLAASLEEQRVGLEQYYSELGHGQHEISTPHAPALRAADEQLLVRETIRGVAAQHDLIASLAPKPWLDNAGNGCHIHFSLWSLDGSRNRFHDAGAPDRLSAEARSFIAGVLAHMPGLCGLTAPSFNSYRRIVPHYWAGAFTCWGHDNREAPVRVPSVFRGMEEASTNAELKAADASSNPYLAVGALIAAGLDGIERGLEPPEPVEVDPATIDEREREARGILRLPATQREALDALEADDVLTSALGPVLARSYLAVRRSEWEAYLAGDEAFEQQGHFSKY